MKTEQRQHSRANISLPVVVMTTDGPVDGETENLSLGGAFIRTATALEPGNSFRLVIRPKKREFLLTTAEMVWSKTFFIDESAYHGTGVCFRKMIDNDRRSLARVISGLL